MSKCITYNQETALEVLKSVSENIEALKYVSKKINRATKVNNGRRMLFQPIIHDVWYTVFGEITSHSIPFFFSIIRASFDVKIKAFLFINKTVK